LAVIDVYRCGLLHVSTCVQKTAKIGLNLLPLDRGYFYVSS
jgi:hypothetical protein